VATAISFYMSAGVALVAALVAVGSRVPSRSVAGFALALAALIVPLLQLRAPFVAALSLLSTGLIVALLGGLIRLGPPSPSSSSSSSSSSPLGRARGAKFWVPACLGLLGFVWSLLAAGSRQVIEDPPVLERGNLGYGAGQQVLEVLAGEHLVAASVVGLLALCSVIAAVLTLVSEGER